MTTNYRFFVEKKPIYRVEANSLLSELNENLNLHLQQLRLLKVYDLFGFTPELLAETRYKVFGEKVTDEVMEVCDMENYRPLSIEYLPGQFDQRAASAKDCVHLIAPDAKIEIKSGLLLLLDKDLTDEDYQRIKDYCINSVEAREKDLNLLQWDEQTHIAPIPILSDFTQLLPLSSSALTDDDRLRLETYRKEHHLVMNVDDLAEVVRYFQQEERQPNETELKILDTYWSDHCRHTTFTTQLKNIEIAPSFIAEDIHNTLQRYKDIKKELGREMRDDTLMELAIIGAKYLRKKGLLDDMEVSEENNACSIFIDVDNDGVDERWLLMFKNETHNHPTEIEPFGGAATCLGGAIRDPLSGRSYIYQAMRVTGAGDILQPVAHTRVGKLPQKKISRTAAHGYSSYGNQIGLATTHVREIYHPGYEAKRMEIGAVVGAVPADCVRRECPKEGDVILLLGGRTGRDGIGGATGSSRQHTKNSIDVCGSEVQKGNAPEERKLQRLFRNPELTRMIKKANDFGAGGVSVAIGELADGLDIYLDRIPLKYKGLNATELSISESQERMSVVIEAKDMQAFFRFCEKENVEVTHVADVRATNRMRIFDGDRMIVDLSRDFINSAGAKHSTNAKITAVKDNHLPTLSLPTTENLKDKIRAVMKDYNTASQRGLIEMFDATIGHSTVLMPFGGKTQRTPTQVSVQKIPTKGFTHTASIMAYGFDPYVTEWSPYHGAAYSVVEVCSKIVAAGGKYEGLRFSYQEYFERMTDDSSTWGKPLAALLGALKMQLDLGLPSIGGKDSMSGSFENLKVPPTLVAFGITTVKDTNVISPEWKKEGHYIYLLQHHALPNNMPNSSQLKELWHMAETEIANKNIVAAYALGRAGLAEGICKMSFGNNIGAAIHVADNVLWDNALGSILVECVEEITHSDAILIGKTSQEATLRINDVVLDIEQLATDNASVFESVYPTGSCPDFNTIALSYNDKTKIKTVPTYKGDAKMHPKVYIPVFPGTNCEYDTAKAFRKAGAEVDITVFNNLSEQHIHESIADIQKHIHTADILMLAGGFSAGDEPDGSGKFIANVLAQEGVAAEIDLLLQRGGLILGICNGFQALIKSGLLPYGKVGSVTNSSPTLFRNDINRHISQIVTTKVVSKASPWLYNLSSEKLYGVAMSHGEGKLVVNEEEAKRLFENGQVAFQYVDPNTGLPTMQTPYNPNGSYYAIEGLISENGQILGKMGHSERYEKGLYKNIYVDMEMDLFTNAVNYFRKQLS